MRRKMLIVADEVKVGDMVQPPSWTGDSAAPVTTREDTERYVRLTVGATTWWVGREEYVKVVRGE